MRTLPSVGAVGTITITGRHLTPLIDAPCRIVEVFPADHPKGWFDFRVALADGRELDAVEREFTPAPE
jgi:hypothetical protein